jgi:hypothetical protein
VILLSTWVFELLEMCTICLGMLLGLSHLRMAGWGGIYSPNPQTSRWTERSSFLSSGAPDRNCAVSGVHHVSRPLASVAVDRWIRPLPTVWCTPDSPVLHPEGVCLRPLCADCPVVPPDSPVHTGEVLFTVRCATRRWLTALF